ncbi:MAG TPA: GIY-YIG nuclease family protein [Acidisphaera sp.]|nr:GIY-YIG nuclease family protein [Acidisphaera sp.]
MTHRPHGILYVGVTSDLERRAPEHRQKLFPGFSKLYGLTRLVFAEHHSEITSAIRREKRIKTWNRAWKARLIEQVNPNWDDLCVTQFGWPPL